MLRSPLESPYDVDMVLCVDVTANTQAHVEGLKAWAPRLHAAVRRHMENMCPQETYESIRIKLIAFRDFAYDDEPLFESDFYAEDSVGEFTGMMSLLHSHGGGDEPESGLEALALACRADWKRTQPCRHVIVMITDASAHPLGASRDTCHDLYSMPKSLDEITDWVRGRVCPPDTRTALITPACEPWTELSNSLPCVGLYPYDSVFPWGKDEDETMDSFCRLVAKHSC